jgi:tetratricopeptide (TPR) repeat protein
MGQTPKFKTLYTEKERKHLIENMHFSLGFSSEMKFSYSTTDLFSDKVEKEQPASLEEIEKLKKTIDGSDEDAAKYLDISSLYSRLKMNREADEYRNKAIEIAERKIEQSPDSIGAYLFLSGVYMGALQPEKSIYYNRLAHSKKPSYLPPLISNATLFLTYFQTDSARVIIDAFLKNHPEDQRVFSIVPMIYMTTIFNKANNSADEHYFTNTPLDSLLATPLLDYMYEKNKSNYDAEFLYRVARMLIVNTVVGVLSVSDTTFDDEYIKFKIPKQLHQEVEANKTFFTNCLKTKDVRYHFYANKILGSIYLLSNETKKATTYLRNTINLKPVSNCSTTSNTNEDYYNLMGAYLILKDTVSYEKVLLEKIKLQPTIDPYAGDYTNLAMLYLYRNKVDLARQTYLKAKAIDEKYLATVEVGELSTAIVGLGVCDFMDNDLESAMARVNEAYKQNSRQWELYVLYTSILIQQRDAINTYETLKALMRLHKREWIQEDFIDYFFEFN